MKTNNLKPQIIRKEISEKKNKLKEIINFLNKKEEEFNIENNIKTNKN